MLFPADAALIQEKFWISGQAAHFEWDIWTASSKRVLSTGVDNSVSLQYCGCWLTQVRQVHGFEPLLSLGKGPSVLIAVTRLWAENEIPQDALKQRLKGKYTIDVGNDWVVPEQSWRCKKANCPFSDQLPRVC